MRCERNSGVRLFISFDDLNLGITAAKREPGSVVPPSELKTSCAPGLRVDGIEYHPRVPLLDQGLDVRLVWAVAFHHDEFHHATDIRRILSLNLVK